MEYTVVDMAAGPRAGQFALYKDMAYPFLGVTVEVDVTGLRERLRAQGLPFYLPLLHSAAAAANDLPELRRRILDGRAVEFPCCEASYTVALDNGSYCYCRVRTDMPLSEFVPYARAEQEKAKQAASLDNGDDVLNLFFFSTLPELSFTALVQPTSFPGDSNPRITWSRTVAREGRTLLPVSLLCHHALADGRHLAQFYQRFSQRLAAL